MRVVTLKRYPTGMISPEDFEIIEKEIPEIANGQALIENIYCSTDPYLRGRMLPPRFNTGSGRFASIEPGEVIQNETIGRVVSSNISGLSEGDYVLHMGGWAEFSTIEEDSFYRSFEVDNTQDIDTQLQRYLVINGLVGRTAYHSLTHGSNLQPGEVACVSGADGGVGHIYIQQARLLGASKVYGITSSQEKANQIEDLGATPVIIPRGSKLQDVLSIYQNEIKEEINCYHENVGNDYFLAAMNCMHNTGRMVYCGAMSLYNNTMPSPGPTLIPLIYKDITIRGCFLSDFDLESYTKMLHTHKDQIKALTTIYHGLDSLPQQFTDHFVFTDTRLGKSLCKL